ncbi:MAG TPA: hypothetical protein GXZ59_03400 [Clostridiaceae bacterium]|nr:hypothetical protein [Clostridiaceae bacterium]
MKIELSKNDISFLREKDVYIDPSFDISKDEALSLLDRVHDIEIECASSEKKSDLRFASIYANIADRIENQIV